MRFTGMMTTAAIAIVAPSSFAGANQWTVTGPPVSVRAMAVHPHDGNILYAAAPDAVARSQDRGATWTLTDIPGAGQPVGIRVAVSDPWTVYTLGSGGLYRSTTGGASWSVRSVPAFGQFQNDLQVDARNAAVVVMGCSNFCLFGCSGGGVFRSEDGGGSWRAIGLKDANVSRVAFDPAASSVLYAVSGGSLFRTGDTGRTWRDVSPPQSGSIQSVAVDPVATSTIYAGAESGVFRSFDSGQSWTLIRAAAGAAMVATQAYGSRQLFASAGGVALTLDQGDSWRELSTAGSGLRFNSLWQVVIGPGAWYMVSDLVGTSGQILAYEIEQPRRRTVRH